MVEINKTTSYHPLFAESAVFQTPEIYMYCGEQVYHLI
jgi:hypothetical protein